MFNEYPYTDYHELNTDWIIGKIKNVETAEANTKQYAEDADAAKTIAVDAKDTAVNAKDTAVQAKDDAQAAESNAALLVSSTRDQLDLLQSRVDNIIPDGTQTAGNTELLDIRVGYDGTTYTSAGDAVRDQVDDIYSTIGTLMRQPYSAQTITAQEGYYKNSGYQYASGFACAEYLCTPGDHILVSASGNASFGAYYFYDSAWTLISKGGEDQKYTDVELLVPANAYYMGMNKLNGAGGIAPTLSIKKISNTDADLINTLIPKIDNALDSNMTLITAGNYSAELPNLDSAKTNTIYNIAGCINSISNHPPVTNQYVTFWSLDGEGTRTADNYTVQFCAEKSALFYRSKMFGGWGSWIKIPADTVRHANVEILDDFVATSIDKTAITGIDSSTSILAFGDSIMQGYSQITQNWISYVHDKTGCTVVNKAVGGACYGESITTAPYFISTQIAGVSAAEWSAANLIILAAGTNDAGNNTPLAELKTKVAAAITAIKAETSAPIIVITPIRRGSSNTDPDLLKLPDISGIICNQALQAECSVINGFDIPIPTFTNGQIDDLTIDHLHPNDAGTVIYAQTFLSKVL